MAPQSAQEFIRVLKSPSDPPQPGGSLKINIARNAWADPKFYVPNKEEVIVEWILTRLLKDKSKEWHTNPIADVRFWSLLLDILNPLSAVTDSKNSTRTPRTWLVPLLSRIPFAPITSSFLSFLAIPDIDFDAQTEAVAWRCICIVWPLAVPKFNPETLLECYGSLLKYLAPRHSSAEASSKTASLIVSSYRTAVSNATNKKKLYSNFIQNHFQCWLEYLGSPPAKIECVEDLHTEVFVSGIDTIFNADVLRQTLSQESEASLDDALAKVLVVAPTAVLASLPRLFIAFLQSIKKHRSVLFSQGSNKSLGATTEQIRDAGMGFFATCDTLLAKSQDEQAVWKTRVSLLSIVDNENLFSASSDGSTNLLRQNVKLAVDSLQFAWKDEHVDRTNLALETLSVLIKIDYDLVSPSFSLIFPRILMVPDAISAADRFLHLTIQHHTKSRTIPTYLLYTMEAFTTQHLKIIPEEPRATYQIASSGPFSTLLYLDRLSRLVHGFLTPGQIMETVQIVLQSLRESFDDFREQEAKSAADSGDGARKKRRKETSVTTSGKCDPGFAAITLSLVAKTASVVLTSLALHTVLDDVQQDIYRNIDETCLVVRATLKEALQVIGAAGRRDTWGWQIVASATMRFQYALAAARHLSSSVSDNDPVTPDILSAIDVDELLPELNVEIFRNLLLKSSGGECEPENILDSILRYMELHIAEGGPSWTGRSHCLTEKAGHGQASIAMFHTLLDRWLPIFDSIASPEQLLRISKIFTSINTTNIDKTVSKNEIPGPMVVIRTLRNAHFWELQNFKDVLITCISEQTASLDDIDVVSALSQIRQGTVRKFTLDVGKISATYGLLLYAPIEYLPRMSRVALLRRALGADVAIGANVRRKCGTGSSKVHSMLVLREFLRRMYSHMGTIDHPMPQEFFDYMMDSELPSVVSDEDMSNYVSATLDLIGLHLTGILKHAGKGDDAMFINVVQSFLKSDVWNVPPEPRSSSNGLRFQALLQLIDSLTTNQKLSEFSQEIKSLLGQLQGCMTDAILPRMTALCSQDHQYSNMLLETALLKLWCRTLVLNRWLKNKSSKTEIFGPSLLHKTLSSKMSIGVEPRSVDVCSSVLAILLGELETFADVERHTHIACIIAGYLSFCNTCGTTVREVLGSQISATCKTMTVPDFSYLLGLMMDGFLDASLTTDQIASLISLSIFVVHNAPEGTLKVTQGYMTHCLNLFADRSMFVEISALRLQVLGFMSKQFNDHSASVRAADLASIWTFLGKCLSASASHEPDTTPAVYHEVIAIVSALIRLRRDLVQSTLPHIGMIMRQLVLALRHPRPQLGAKQTKMVMDSLPSWISARSPLFVEESQALARLLSAFTTKTIPRTNSASTEAQKAESLARPFSKHAAGVLMAYVTAANDPLCVMPMQVRKELQPGLFALCDMLGEQNRDAMMMSALDGSGKIAMKTLWQEYEKQKYVGKG